MNNEEEILRTAKDITMVCYDSLSKELQIVESMLSYLFALQGWTPEQYMEIRKGMEERIDKLKKEKEQNENGKI